MWWLHAPQNTGALAGLLQLTVVAFIVVMSTDGLA